MKPASKTRAKHVQGSGPPTDGPAMATVGPEPPMLPLRLVGLLLRWSPVWVPVLLIWQITQTGLRPALAEQERLAAERPAVEERHALSQEDFDTMAAQRRAWEDELYRERVRRLRDR